MNDFQSAYDDAMRFALVLIVLVSAISCLIGFVITNF